MKAEEIIPGLRSLIAQRLVEKYGFNKKAAANILGLSPAAITLYLQGKRAEEIVRILSRKKTLKLIDTFTERVVERGGRIMTSELYELAFEVLTVLKASESERPSTFAIQEDKLRKLLEFLRVRLQAEQESAEEFMRVAAKLKSNLVRMLFRIVASDSIKHADIMMLILSIIERGGEIEVDKLDREILMKLLSKEEIVHVHSLDEVKQFLPHQIIKILVEAIEYDERKHAQILKELLDYASTKQDYSSQDG